MKITYISHSGFAVELPSATLLFDYYKGELPTFTADKPLYVFASHSHGDHFVPQIFDLVGQYPQVHFVFSHDIWMTRKKHTRAGVPEAMFESATYLRAHETRRFSLTGADSISSETSLPDADATLPGPHTDANQPLLTVTTLRSTDMGVAFLVECDGLRIYHAGDLHWWLWPGDTKQSANNMTANYQREIGHLAELLSAASSLPPHDTTCNRTSAPYLQSPHLDLAFLPLDPRLEENYALGMEYFLQQITVDHVFPMHMWDDYTVIDRFTDRRAQCEIPLHCGQANTPPILYKIKEEGQSWTIS